MTIHLNNRLNGATTTQKLSTTFIARSFLPPRTHTHHDLRRGWVVLRGDRKREDVGVDRLEIRRREREIKTGRGVKTHK